MTRRAKLTAEARADLRDLTVYIKRDSPQAAEGLRTDLLNAALRLAEHPGLGQRRSDLTRRDVRFWNVRGYVICYSQMDKSLIVVRIFAPGRDITGALD